MTLGQHIADHTPDAVDWLMDGGQRGVRILGQRDAVEAGDGDVLAHDQAAFLGSGHCVQDRQVITGGDGRRADLPHQHTVS